MSIAGEGLDGQALYDVISGVGNHEMKSLVFAQLRDDLSYSESPLHAKTLAMQGETPAWPVTVGLPIAYCETFAKVGIAANAGSEPVAYAINELGKNYALPLVGHLLEVSLQENQALYNFHGPTQTNAESGKRPSQHRLEIMQSLRERDGRKISMAKVAAKLGIRISHAGAIAEDLAAEKIIERESSGRGKSTITYTPEPGLKDVTLRRDVGSQLLFDVVDVLQKHFKSHETAIDNRQIASTLIADYSYSQDLTALIKNVSRRTNLLATRRKVLKAHREIGQAVSREVIWATGQQLATIDNLLQAIDGIRKPKKEYLFEGHDKLELIINDYNLVNYLAAKARAHSPGLKRLPQERQQGINKVRQIMTSSPTALSVREIQASLQERGINLDKSTVRSYAGIFVRLGQAAVIRTEEGEKYSLVAT